MKAGTPLATVDTDFQNILPITQEEMQKINQPEDTSVLKPVNKAECDRFQKEKGLKLAKQNLILSPEEMKMLRSFLFFNINRFATKFSQLSACPDVLKFCPDVPKFEIHMEKNTTPVR